MPLSPFASHLNWLNIDDGECIISLSSSIHSSSWKYLINHQLEQKMHCKKDKYRKFTLSVLDDCLFNVTSLLYKASSPWCIWVGKHGRHFPTHVHHGLLILASNFRSNRDCPHNAFMTWLDSQFWQHVYQANHWHHILNILLGTTELCKYINYQNSFTWTLTD